MFPGAPIFSAAHASQFEKITGKEWAHDGGPKWRKVKDEGLQWGYQLEQELTPALYPTKRKPSKNRTKKELEWPEKARTTCRFSHWAKASNMTLKTHTWISLWFLLTAPVIFWDAGYCFMRPRSMVGGDLHWIWKPYSIYQDIDYVYGVKALQDGDGFTNAQSFMNIVETLLNLAYVYLAHVSAWPPAIIVGLSAAVMTVSKTWLYWLQEYYCGFCSIGHNSGKDLLVYWIIPNGLWIVIPTLIVIQLGKDLSSALHVAQKASKTVKNK